MNNTARYRIVLDTNVVVAAGSRWVMTDPPTPLPDHFPSFFVHCVTTFHIGLVCEDIMLEYAEKLETFNHPPDRVERYLGHLAGACEFVEIILFCCQHRPVDPDDTIFLLCALNGNADFVVSEDNDLLELKDKYNPPKIRTCKEMQIPLALA